MDDSRSDLQLLQATRGGDGAAFELFYRRHREFVLAYCRGRVREPTLAADLMAETFTSALIATHEPERALPEAPFAWPVTIAQRKLIDSYRRGRVRDEARRRLALERLELDDNDLAEIEEVAGRVDLLRELREKLPAEQAEALIARVLDEHSYPELAGELQCSEAVARKRVSRALKALRGVIGDATA